MCVWQRGRERETEKREGERERDRKKQIVRNGVRIEMQRKNETYTERKWSDIRRLRE
jgi:hypothetical protein